MELENGKQGCARLVVYSRFSLQLAAVGLLWAGKVTQNKVMVTPVKGGR